LFFCAVALERQKEKREKLAEEMKIMIDQEKKNRELRRLEEKSMSNQLELIGHEHSQHNNANKVSYTMHDALDGV